VFPISISLILFWLSVYAIVAMVTGAFSGKLASIVLGVPTSGLLQDGWLGLLGFLMLGLALVFVPTLGDLLNKFGNPSNVALIAAPVLPFFRELCRFVGYRISSAAVSRRLHQLQGQ